MNTCHILFFLFLIFMHGTGLEDIQLNELVSIRVRGNPIPFAVGVSLVSWEGIQHNGMRGRAVHILHVYGDCLCHKWNRNAPINDGFSMIRIMPLAGYEEPLVVKEKMIYETEGGLNSAEGEDACTEEGVQHELPVKEHEKHNGDIKESVGQEEAEPEAIAVMSGEANPGESRDNELNKSEMDIFLEVLLLRALYYIVKDKHLPFAVSSLWALILR